jgi:hypothetical protein
MTKSMTTTGVTPFGNDPDNATVGGGYHNDDCYAKLIHSVAVGAAIVVHLLSVLRLLLLLSLR